MGRCTNGSQWKALCIWKWMQWDKNSLLVRPIHGCPGYQTQPLPSSYYQNNKVLCWSQRAVTNSYHSNSSSIRWNQSSSLNSILTQSCLKFVRFLHTALIPLGLPTCPIIGTASYAKTSFGISLPMAYLVSAYCVLSFLMKYQHTYAWFPYYTDRCSKIISH